MNEFHTDSTRTARAGHFAGRGRLVAWTAAGVMAVSLGVAGCGDQDNGGGGGRTTHGADREAEQAAGSTWAAGITPEWMSERMGLTVPATANSPEAAYEITSRFDTGLLTFTLTRSEAETYLKENPPKGKWLEPTAAATDVKPHDFAHFGLPEPETFKDGVRYGYVCPSTKAPQATGTPSGASEDPFGSSDAYDTTDERCVRLYAHEYSPDRTRIYLRAHYEPGISNLPAPSSSPN
ncbi:hypothetical protein [Streptomyces sp. Ncost-T10-10d]|uniref:hypothetical protein n=1 Tax=Streptomyces sp. Ncost-T10-10d TaxID=1839774 RepID=UPI00081F4525|nr:hypothetical protein [Streptomyces sp. Ncost-T10-10d]SCF59795.1 hypothetical protein GA0115254_106332 [Streptomyces sp. Ncost-T10-10d]